MNHTVTLNSGITVPAIGLGSWFIGESKKTRQQEMEALAAGVEAGMTLIDTAEMYGNGRSEELVGETISGMHRSRLFLVSKVLPTNANSRRMRESCENSLRRMKTDYLDLYLYHWRGGTPLEETVYCLEELKKSGKILSWGVSNFDTDDMKELFSVENGRNCTVNQVLYHLGSRGIEYDLLPWMKKHDVALMSYCPLAQAGSLRDGLFESPALKKVADKHRAGITQILLAWNIRNGFTITIPKSSRKEHTLQNFKADSITLDEEDFSILDSAFPEPKYKMPLDTQ